MPCRFWRPSHRCGNDRADRPDGIRSLGRQVSGKYNDSSEPVSVQFVGPSAIHSHSLDAPDSDQLYADIIAAAPIVGKSDQFFRCEMEILALAANRTHFRRIYRPMQTVRA